MRGEVISFSGDSIEFMRRTKLTSGQKVTITRAPRSLLRGLPLNDQTAIKNLVGKLGKFVQMSAFGYAEIEFEESATEYRTIWVGLSVVIPYRGRKIKYFRR